MRESRRWWQRRSGAPGTMRTEDLRTLCEHHAATRIEEAVAGQRVVLAGIVQSVRIRPIATSGAMEAELSDGTGAVRLVWLGREHIAGIEVGRCMVVHGRLVTDKDGSMVFNPRYTLIASR